MAESENQSDVTSQCMFCRKEVPSESETDFSKHLLSEHNIRYEVDSIIKTCLRTTKTGTKDSNSTDGRQKASSSMTQDCSVQTDKPGLVNVAVQTTTTGSSPTPGRVPSSSSSSSSTAAATTSRKIPWFAGCEYRCRVCGKVYFYNEDLREHIRRRHFSPNQYLEKFHSFETKAAVLKCKVCSMSIKRHYTSVWSHLNKDHGISLFEYQEKYGMKDYLVTLSVASQNGCVTSESGVTVSSDDDTPETSAEFQKRLNPERRHESSEAKRPRLTIEPLKVSTPNAPKAAVAPTTSDSKLWFIGCEYGCMISECKSMVYDMPDMMEHIKTVHEMTPRQYMDLFRKLESKFHWYSCGVCQSRVKHQKSTIVKHLETHNMTLVKYTEIFHPNELGAVSQEKRAVAPATGLVTASAPSPRITYDRWSRGECKFRCGVCKFTSECSAEFWKHAAKEHLLNIADYKAELGNPCVTYKEIQCLGCNKLLRYDPGTLANHASHAHDMSMEDFYEAFFKPPGSDSKDETDGRVLDDEDLEKYEDEARQWSDQCVYECRICNSVSYMNYGSLFDHIRSKHNISVDSYKSEYGEMASKKVMHHCRLCQVEFLHTSAIMRKHLKRCHEITIPQYFLDHIKYNSDNETATTSGHTSDDGEAKVPMDQETSSNYAKWKKGCEYECKVCTSVHFSWSNLNAHLKSAHDIGADEYRDAHGILMTKKSYHKCFICRAPIIQEAKNLKLHMKKRHDLYLDEYYVKYVSPKGGRRPPSLPFQHNQQLLPARSVHSAATAAGNKGTISFADWKYACRYDCKICAFSTRHSSDFSTHMSGKHGQSLAEYSKVHGRAMTVRVQHKCLICGNLIIQQPQSMKGHMTMHALTLDEYFVKYILGQGQEENEQDNGTYSDGGGEDVNEEEASNDYYHLEESTFDGDDRGRGRVDGSSRVDTGMDDSTNGNDGRGDAETDDKDISYDEWRHACVYTCKICQHSSKHHADIYSHMLSKHDMSIREYGEQYGKPMTKEVYHNCHICGKDLLQQSKNIKKHVKSHNITLEKYFEVYVKGGKVSKVVRKQESVREGSSTSTPFSHPAPRAHPNFDPNLSDYAKWKNACKFECKVCNYSTKAYFTFNFHVKDKHGMVVQDYIKEYGKPMTKKVYHRCIICGAAFLQIAKTITRHLQLHAITLQNYYDQYVVGDDGAKSSAPSTLDQAIRAPRSTATPPKKAPLRMTKEVRMSKCLSKSPYLTFCWNQCKETCGMCGQVFSTSATLHKHVRFVHNVDLEWYKSHHVTSVDDISTVCLMCNESVQLTQKSMETHLRSSHSMSLMNYEEQYKIELSQQFEQLQNIRQSNVDEDGNDVTDPDHEDPLSLCEQSANFPDMAEMIKTEIQVDDEDASYEMLDEDEEDEYLDDDNDETADQLDLVEMEELEEQEDEDDDNGAIPEPEQTMLEGSEETPE